MDYSKVEFKKDIDAVTFLFITGGAYTRNKKGVFFGLYVVNDTDGHPLYYTGKQVVGVDPEIFVI